MCGARHWERVKSIPVCLQRNRLAPVPASNQTEVVLAGWFNTAASLALCRWIACDSQHWLHMHYLGNASPFVGQMCCLLVAQRPTAFRYHVPWGGRGVLLLYHGLQDQIHSTRSSPVSAFSCGMICQSGNVVQAWPIALAVAQFSGPDRLHGILRKFLDDALLPGSAIHIFSLLATRSFDSVTVSMQASAAGVGNPDRYALLDTQATVPGTWRTEVNTTLATHVGRTYAPAAAGPSMTVADVQQKMPGDRPSAQQVDLNGQAPQRRLSMRDSNWRKSLLMIVANRSAGDMPALAALGDDLWAVKHPELWQYAHVCYILAGKLLGSAADPSCTFVVPGVDHTSAMGACGRIDSLQRIELLAWCHMQCHGMPMYCVIPSYIMVSRHQSPLYHRVCTLMLR